MIDVETMKNLIEQGIKKRNFENLHYVLFDEQNSQPWAFHLFYKDGKFMINGNEEIETYNSRLWEFLNQIEKLES